MPKFLLGTCGVTTARDEENKPSKAGFNADSSASPPFWVVALDYYHRDAAKRFMGISQCALRIDDYSYFIGQRVQVLPTASSDLVPAAVLGEFGKIEGYTSSERIRIIL